MEGEVAVGRGGGGGGGGRVGEEREERGWGMVIYRASGTFEVSFRVNTDRCDRVMRTRNLNKKLKVELFEVVHIANLLFIHHTRVRTCAYLARGIRYKTPFFLICAGLSDFIFYRVCTVIFIHALITCYNSRL